MTKNSVVRGSRATTSPGLSRRALLLGGGGGAALVTMSLAACSGDAADDADERTTPDADRPKEAPMLTEMVEAGDLPPLDERLPVEGERLELDTPEFGVYGGTYNGVVRGPGDEVWVERLTGYEPMLRPTPDLSEIGLPGILKDIEMNDDGTEYTLHMRQGLRWSDGEPVTSDDVMFALDDVYFNEELNSTPPGLLSVDGEPCTGEQIDEVTVRLTFPKPKGDFIPHASRQGLAGGNLFNYAKHYFTEFHPDYNDDLDDLVDSEGFTDWTALWEDKEAYVYNPDKPVLNAWIALNSISDGGVMEFERNPYYFKVDTDGAQLPFIDRMSIEIVSDDEVMVLKALNGEIDFMSRHINTPANRPVLADSRETGNYNFVTFQGTSCNVVSLALNLNHDDEELREIFQSKDFRIGLSHAIDRQDIIDTVYQRQGEPWQMAPHPESEFFDEEFAKQYTEFDLDLANQHLDDAGLTEKDSEGFRLKPSGGRLRFAIDVIPEHTERIAALNLIVQTWEQVGISASVNTIERTLYYDRKTAAANQNDAASWGGDGGLRTEMIDTRWWFPTNDESLYAPRWAEWNLTRGNGEHAEEPPEATQRQIQLFRELMLDPDLEAQAEKFNEIIQIAKEQFYLIGIALPGDEYAIVKNDLRNVVEGYVDSPQHLSPGNAHPTTWYFDDEE